MGILIPDISITEKVARSVVVYGFLLIAFRLSGKRRLGQKTPFDIAVLLIIRRPCSSGTGGSFARTCDARP